MAREQVTEQGSAAEPAPAEVQARPPQSALSTPLTPQAMLALQRTAGNAAAAAVARRTRTLARMARICCEPEEVRTPDVPGTTADNDWWFTVAVDRESADWWESTGGGEVGHSWVKLTDAAGARYSFGFYPEESTSLLGLPETGCILHPDMGHERAKGYLDQTYWISEHAFNRALSFIEEACRNKASYLLYANNCTSFVLDVARAANVTLPLMHGVVASPNNLYDAIVDERARLDELLTPQLEQTGPDPGTVPLPYEDDPAKKKIKTADPGYTPEPIGF